MQQLHKGAIGAAIRVVVIEEGMPFPASTATVKTLKMRKPSGAVIERPIEFETNGSDGRFVYTTVSGDLDEAGRWQAQLLLTLSGGGSWHTSVFAFPVAENLS